MKGHQEKVPALSHSLMCYQHIIGGSEFTVDVFKPTTESHVTKMFILKFKVIQEERVRRQEQSLGDRLK